MSKTTPEELLATLPERTRRYLEELRSSLSSALAADLCAIVVFGSAVRGGYRPEQSDVDVMVVLEDDRRELVERIGPALLVARNAARIEAMIVRRAEIPRAADVFPLLYDDIRDKSVVLHGKSPFEDLHITDANRRLRIEQELRELRIRGRRLLSDSDGNDPLLAAGLDRKMKQARSPLHALLRLHGQQISDSMGEVLRAAAAHYGVDPSPLFASRESPRAAYDTLTALLDAAISDVDALDPER